MTEMKYCFGCQRKREIEHFEEGFKSCNVCREKKKGIQTETYYCEPCDFEGKIGCKARHKKSQRHQPQQREIKIQIYQNYESLKK